MSRSGDLWLALACSVGLHAGAFVASARWMPSAATLPDLPLFKLGDSSVALTLLPPDVPDSNPDAAPVALVDPVVESPPVPPPLEATPVDADLQEKGVQEMAAETVGVRPHYPLGARLRNEEGTVRLRVRVGASGRPERVEVTQSSGYASLDKAAGDAFWAAGFPSTDTAAGPRTYAFAITFRLETP